tara:strand:- start:422 stop:679 length:258 start_codon:yes stop_codon:yes gene_type:complete
MSVDPRDVDLGRADAKFVTFRKRCGQSGLVGVGFEGPMVCVFRRLVLFQTVKCESEIAESIGVGGVKRDGLAELRGRIFEPVEIE